ncbi:MAG TPA: hemophore-related protein, partial [Mycobacterium sp.]|nr:hemophore-related protein [Mycobacterium sp.]
LQQQDGPQSIMMVKNYFDANPKVGDDLRKISEPLTQLTAQCELPVSLPQMLGLVQAAQNPQGALPGQLPKPAEVLGKTGRLPGPPTAAGH